MRKAVAHIKGFPGASQALREDPADQHVNTRGFGLTRALQLAPGMGWGYFPCPELHHAV